MKTIIVDVSKNADSKKVLSIYLKKEEKTKLLIYEGEKVYGEGAFEPHNYVSR